MNWDKVIERNTLALLRIVGGLFALQFSAQLTVSGLMVPRFVWRSILLVLRPAGSAVRRLITQRRGDDKNAPPRISIQRRWLSGITAFADPNQRSCSAGAYTSKVKRRFVMANFTFEIFHTAAGKTMTIEWEFVPGNIYDTNIWSASPALLVESSGAVDGKGSRLHFCGGSSARPHMVSIALPSTGGLDTVAVGTVGTVLNILPAAPMPTAGWQWKLVRAVP